MKLGKPAKGKMMAKYKIKLSDLEKVGGASRLERDGHKREAVIREMYKLTDGANTHERERIVSNLYDRKD